eukprot:3161558-Rhodomonas_salina.1
MVEQKHDARRVGIASRHQLCSKASSQGKHLQNLTISTSARRVGEGAGPVRVAMSMTRLGLRCFVACATPSASTSLCVWCLGFGV